MQGARLLDVGCGTSILSMFGAQGGAAAVVGLDGSDRIANCARQVGAVRASGLCPGQQLWFCGSLC
jgi:ribosomal protein L11 methylase PrmA